MVKRKVKDHFSLSKKFNGASLPFGEKFAALTRLKVHFPFPPLRLFRRANQTNNLEKNVADFFREISMLLKEVSGGEGRLGKVR